MLEKYKTKKNQMFLLHCITVIFVMDFEGFSVEMGLSRNDVNVIGKL
jgi:hypothetical protein